ncbi:AcrR family transcriptional regulator [Arthrobacter silviterrae]|uniref:TetR/AcrR family transcriptional regulator n=1 Tax=Arthrobacter silviterrae TaxID=2026658 RepID=A0ABX0D5Q8_9MICC|nr:MULTISPECIES: TetR/AcrR family transcriptional regulator [Arthrobacter]MCU6480733.1 TetR/AcrR family transcriptional regulator [Arthrobacter sp. A2-55]MDQ0278520.1 AcrR family transcriptional regulator [Arthrobacter silviterrae]NGN82222.1 TetR/AcrR family transcriptional regulator [Arthrobacter silviterrae]
MPRIAAPTNAAQREQTQRKILDAFGELLFSHGLPGLTMTDVARSAGVGRTAVYNYFADLEQLLVAFALDETGRFVSELKARLDGLENPVDRLSLYVRAQLEDLTRRHLPPGPAMRSVLSSESFAKLAVHVGELNRLLEDILRDGMDQRFLPEADVEGLVQLIHGSLTASASRRTSGAEEERVAAAVRFIQAGVGAAFDDDGRPVTIR